MPKEEEGMYFSAHQLQEFMAKAMAAAVAEARKMTPLEERRYNEEVEREQRRWRMALELQKAEDQNARNRMLGCSHKADSKTGLAIGRDRMDGNWTTGGQMHGNDLATLACMRCGWVWRWRTTPAERDYISNVGMLYMAPPADDRVKALKAEEEERDRQSMMKQPIGA